MPYAHRRKKIPRELDRRIRVTEEKREEIKTLYRYMGLSQRAISRQTRISRRMICFILFPEKEAICKAQYKERRKDGRYYDKDKHREAMREYGRYKQSIRARLVD